jgi:hypothetical protein
MSATGATHTDGAHERADPVMAARSDSWPSPGHRDEGVVQDDPGSADVWLSLDWAPMIPIDRVQEAA